MIEKLETYGEWTYRMSWLLEITAATIGFSIAIVMIINGFESSNAEAGFFAPVINQIGAAGAFVMVALAELTKIPLATLLFAVQGYLKRLAVLIILFGMAAITFETVFFGLERAHTIRESQYTDIVQKISIEEAKISITKLNEGDKSFSVTENNKRQDISKLENDLVALDKRAEQQLEKMRLDGISEEDKSKISSIGRNIVEIDNQLKILEDDWANWSGAKQKNYDDFVAQTLKEMELIAQNGDTERAIQHREKKLGPVATPKNRPKWIQKEAKFIREAGSLRDSRQALFLEKETLLDNVKITDENRKRIQKFATDIEDKKKKIENRIEQLNNDLYDLGDRRFAFDQEKLNRAEQGLKAKQAIEVLQAERIKQARLDQVRRLASKFYDVKPEAVTEDQAGSVALVWFGSLSLLAALAGPVTAITALSLKNIAQVRRRRLTEPQRALELKFGDKFYRSMRYFIVHWRFSRKKTVIKEVAVQQVVKEYVYLPLLADEPDEVVDMLERELPEEVRAEIKGRVVDINSDDAAKNQGPDTTAKTKAKTTPENKNTKVKAKGKKAAAKKQRAKKKDNSVSRTSKAKATVKNKTNKVKTKSENAPSKKQRAKKKVKTQSKKATAKKKRS